MIRREGMVVKGKRVRRLMRLMGMEEIYKKRNKSKGYMDKKVYMYVWRGMRIEREKEVM